MQAFKASQFHKRCLPVTVMRAVGYPVARSHVWKRRTGRLRTNLQWGGIQTQFRSLKSPTTSTRAAKSSGTGFGHPTQARAPRQITRDRRLSPAANQPVGASSAFE